MRDFSEGVRSNDNEDEYQAALREYSDGLVLSLNRSRHGEFTLHKATCKTVAFQEGETNRSGKILFHNYVELNDWVSQQPNLETVDLNRCSRCM